MEILFLAQTLSVLLGFVREDVWTNILTLSIIEQATPRLSAKMQVNRTQLSCFFPKVKGCNANSFGVFLEPFKIFAFIFYR